MISSRIALGTAQFGMPYGVANKEGQISIDKIKAIIEYAHASHIDTLDTAIAYGDSEQCLGEAGVEEWHVISKLPAIPSNCQDVVAWVKEEVSGSLQRLNIKKLYGLLLHRPMQLLESEGDVLYKAMEELKIQGIVKKIGFSIYEPKELDALCSQYKPDIVQVPFNVIDRRIYKSGWLEKLKDINVEVHIRSVFLQGLLLMKPASRPPYFNRWDNIWSCWQQWIDDSGLDQVQACLQFVLSFPEVDRVVVGIDNLKQLKDIVFNLGASMIAAPIELESNDVDLVNPSRWEIN